MPDSLRIQAPPPTRRSHFGDIQILLDAVADPGRGRPHGIAGEMGVAGRRRNLGKGSYKIRSQPCQLYGIHWRSYTKAPVGRRQHHLVNRTAKTEAVPVMADAAKIGSQCFHQSAI